MFQTLSCCLSDFYGYGSHIWEESHALWVPSFRGYHFSNRYCFLFAADLNVNIPAALFLHLFCRLNWLFAGRLCEWSGFYSILHSAQPVGRQYWSIFIFVLSAIFGLLASD